MHTPPLPPDASPALPGTPDAHALETHLRAALAAAERVAARHPDDRAPDRLCLYLYDALELLDKGESSKF